MTVAQRLSLTVFGLLLACSGSASESSGSSAGSGGGSGSEAAASCADSACGPAMGMPNTLCDDGVTVSGPSGRCLRDASGACGWEVVSCPPAGSGAGGSALGAAVCGSRGSAPCPTGTFCDFGAGSNCGADDRGGSCQPVPTACTREYSPVCGCDGQTYATGCTAHAASVAVAHDGPC